MSGDTEKDSAQVPESECLLESRDIKAGLDRDMRESRDRDAGQVPQEEMCTSRLLDGWMEGVQGRDEERAEERIEERAEERVEELVNGDAQSRRIAGPATAITVPSIVVDDVDESGCDLDDDPPPYSAIVPPNHVGWPFDFSPGMPGIAYSAHTTTPLCRADLPLAPFQTSLASGTAFCPEGSAGQQASIAVPFTPYRLFKLGSHRSLFANRNPAHDGPLPNNGLAVKYDTGKTRRYGAILMAGAVIIFLMALSLMVRFVVERSFWRG